MWLAAALAAATLPPGVQANIVVETSSASSSSSRSAELLSDRQSEYRGSRGETTIETSSAGRFEFSATDAGPFDRHRVSLRRLSVSEVGATGDDIGRGELIPHFLDFRSSYTFSVEEHASQVSEYSLSAVTKSTVHEAVVFDAPGTLEGETYQAGDVALYIRHLDWSFCAPCASDPLERRMDGVGLDVVLELSGSEVVSGSRASTSLGGGVSLDFVAVFADGIKSNLLRDPVYAIQDATTMKVSLRFPIFSLEATQVMLLRMSGSESRPSLAAEEGSSTTVNDNASTTAIDPDKATALNARFPVAAVCSIIIIASIYLLYLQYSNDGVVDHDDGGQ